MGTKITNESFITKRFINQKTGEVKKDIFNVDSPQSKFIAKSVELNNFLNNNNTEKISEAEIIHNLTKMKITTFVVKYASNIIKLHLNNISDFMYKGYLPVFTVTKGATYQFLLFKNGKDKYYLIQNTFNSISNNKGYEYLYSLLNIEDDKQYLIDEYDIKKLPVVSIILDKHADVPPNDYSRPDISNQIKDLNTKLADEFRIQIVKRGIIDCHSDIKKQKQLDKENNRYIPNIEKDILFNPDLTEKKLLSIYKNSSNHEDHIFDDFVKKNHGQSYQIASTTYYEIPFSNNKAYLLPHLNRKYLYVNNTFVKYWNHNQMHGNNIHYKKEEFDIISLPIIDLRNNHIIHKGNIQFLVDKKPPKIDNADTVQSSINREHRTYTPTGVHDKSQMVIPKHDSPEEAQKVIDLDNVKKYFEITKYKHDKEKYLNKKIDYTQTYPEYEIKLKTTTLNKTKPLVAYKVFSELFSFVDKNNIVIDIKPSEEGNLKEFPISNIIVQTTPLVTLNYKRNATGHLLPYTIRKVIREGIIKII